MKTYRYSFLKSSLKYNCPECHKKTFVRYNDAETGELLPEVYGRCDRESKCGYHLNPYRDGYLKNENSKEHWNNSERAWKKASIFGKVQPTPNVTFPIPSEVLKSTLNGYKSNVFIQNLLKRVPFQFDIIDIEKVIANYFIGTISRGYRAGAVTFPFIDVTGNIRAIQVKQFDETNHTTGTDQIHSVYSRPPFVKILDSVFDPVTGLRLEVLPDWIINYRENDSKFSCLFGEHLLKKYPSNPIALVEAPKTAIIATLYFGLPYDPKKMVWLAVGSLSYLKFKRCKALKGRNVVLFPDLSIKGSAFQSWSQMAKELSEQMPGTNFAVSDYLERITDDKQRELGWDLADFLIEQDWRNFRNPNHEVSSIPIKSEKGENGVPCKKTILREELKPELPREKKSAHFAHYKKGESENRDLEILELEKYFSGITFPSSPISLDCCSSITDLPKFIQTNLTAAKANNGNLTFTPYLQRLKDLKAAIETPIN